MSWRDWALIPRGIGAALTVKICRPIISGLFQEEAESSLGND
jgi:hypothetical protein